MNEAKPSSSQHENQDSSVDNDVDLCNLIDSDEPELRRLDDENEKIIDEVVKIDLMSNLLSDYGDDGEKLADRFRLLKIEFRDLASLSDDDLKQFGVESPQKRQRMLNYFGELPNQNEYYERALNAIDVKQYGHDGLKNIHKHLNYLKLAITASLLKIQIHPSEDVSLPSHLNASDLVLRTLEEMIQTSDLMRKQVSLASNNPAKTSKRSKFWGIVLLFGATAVTSAIFLKYCRTKLF